MHLLCVGVMKNLIESWITGRKSCRLSTEKNKELKMLLSSFSSNVPSEFQRKIFDLDDLSHWKATQYRFVLFYFGHVLTEFILPKDLNMHYSLLFAACRILSHENLAKKDEYVALAEKFLKNFFVLMPTFYGKDCQVMNYHNLIHITDDVRYMGASIAHFSSFPFENCLSHIKKLIRTPVEPLAQVLRRFAELETCSEVEVKPHTLFSLDIHTTKGFFLKQKSQSPQLTAVKFNNFNITTKKPNNAVQLNNGKIYLVEKLYLKKKKS